MDFKTLKKRLAEEAKAANICAEWYNHILNATSKERLLALYFGGFDFVTENDFPSEPLRREFDDVRKHFHIYENEAFAARNARKLVAYTGTRGKAEYNGFAVAQIWLRQGAEVEVTASGNAYVTLDVAEGADAKIKASGKSKVVVFHHGGTITQEATDEAIITIKQ